MVTDETADGYHYQVEGDDRDRYVLKPVDVSKWGAVPDPAADDQRYRA